MLKQSSFNQLKTTASSQIVIGDVNSSQNFTYSSLKISQWGEAQFLKSEQKWQALLENSDCDPLFCSRRYLHSWWKQNKKTTDKLAIYVIENSSSVVAIAPFYISQDKDLYGLYKITRLQFLGKRFNHDRGIRSEYMGIVVDNYCPVPLLEKLFNRILNDVRWSEICLADVRAKGRGISVFNQLLAKTDMHSRIEQEDKTYVVNCGGKFEDYLASLGKNTRLQLYNRRKMLETMGDLKVEIEMITPKNVENFYQAINQFSIARWGKKGIVEYNRELYTNAFKAGSSQSQLIYSSMLKLGGKPISVMINAVANNKVYNLTLNYEQNLHPKLAVGMLHLGYTIEMLFKDKNIVMFDLLAGIGKRVNYKERIGSESAVFESHRWIKPLPLKMIYGFYDRFIRS